MENNFFSYLLKPSLVLLVSDDEELDKVES